MLFDWGIYRDMPDAYKTVLTVLFCMFIGVIVAAAVSLYHNYVLGAFVRFLLESGADCEEKAIKFNETKFNKNFFVKSALKNGRTYNSVIRAAGQEDAKNTKSPDNVKYYIPEELRFRAENLFSKKGSGVKAVLLGILIFVLAAAASLFIIPAVIELLGSF